jgi:hypothetical protein
MWITSPTPSRAVWSQSLVILLTLALLRVYSQSYRCIQADRSTVAGTRWVDHFARRGCFIIPV